MKILAFVIEAVALVAICLGYWWLGIGLANVAIMAVSSEEFMR